MPLSKHMTLKNLDLEVMKGEFICVIGDVGSGKSSLLNAVSGDLIFVPEAEIAAFGGFDKVADQQAFKDLQTKVLSKDLRIEQKPVRINGKVSYVEQSSWI